MPGIRTPTYLWRDTIQIPNSRCGALTEDAGVDSADAGANRMIFVLRYVAQATFLLKYGITVTELHAFVTYFMPIQHLCFCVHLDLLVQSSDSA